ncbi:biopolymer transporter ExbD [Pedobacter sp. UBA4863]|uniref:ExbD/TolR family protein n=1 Tax=Pedobacter sp. UBA4863 TaxID=1947060 RepID=UPI0025D46135|nr:biopolymer transporter ExbD [Pedobacter sp. UBA4863]
MATLNIPQSGKAVRGSARKPIPGVDLTAMVDLAFLLITFFMLTTSLTKMSAMDIAKPVPVDDVTQLQPYPASKTMTILLGKNHKVAYFLGEAEIGKMQLVNLEEIRKVILDSKKMVAKTHSSFDDREMYIIVKPTNTAVFKDFVDVIDEIRINKVNVYAVDDKYLLDEEISFMKNKGI